jgi:NADH dehydrogenase
MRLAPNLPPSVHFPEAIGMKILVTGGTGIIGEATVRALTRRGHGVRVLTRHAERAEPWWPTGVEGWAGDVSDESSIRGAGDGCEVVLHIAGIAAEDPPASTFQSINVDGTRYVVLEAERCGARRVVYVSSLGAERGRSAYHKSKAVAEAVVQAFSREWVIVRPGAVYGPGDENISVLLRMVRTLPMIPTIGDGDQRFQPIWHEDVAEALALSVERDDVRNRVLDVAGPDVTSQNDLTARLRRLTDRTAVQAPVPEFVASWGLRALGAIGVEVPFSEAQMAMLTEGNFIRPGETNALIDVLGVSPTALDDGLRRLATEQREQHPSAGVGSLMRKRYWVDMPDAPRDADAMFAHLRDHLPDLMPSVVEMKRSGPGDERIVEGTTLTLDLPVRGQVQVRAAEVRDRRMTLLTLEGHPIAGAVRFLIDPVPSGIRFEVQVYDRPASILDEVILRAGGDWLQRAVWIGLAENVARAAGGALGGVQSTEETLDDRQLQIVDEWAKGLTLNARGTPH